MLEYVYLQFDLLVSLRAHTEVAPYVCWECRDKKVKSPTQAVLNPCTGIGLEVVHRENFSRFDIGLAHHAGLVQKDSKEIASELVFAQNRICLRHLNQWKHFVLRRWGTSLSVQDFVSFSDDRNAAFTIINLARSVKWAGSFVESRIS